MLHHRLRRRIDDERRAAARLPDGGATAGAPDVPTPATAPGAGARPGSGPRPDLDVDVVAEGPWQVRRAGLVDINPIARLLQAHRPFIDLDGDGEPDEVADPEQAVSATRLVLSHGALEHGEVWFAEDAAGMAAVAVWMPPDADGLAQDLHRVVARELGEPLRPDPELAHTPLRSLVEGTTHLMRLMQESDARRVLILLSDAGRTEDVPGRDRRTLLADVLAPVVTAEVLAGRGVLAVTVDPAQVADLEALGFAEATRSPLGAASLWLGALRPSAVDRAPDGAVDDESAQAAIATV
ncbi:MAG TPA: hypothetical protein VGC57_09565 [Cellulomonas sp.]